LFTADVLLGDQLSVPTQQRIRADKAGKVSQYLSSYDFGLFRKPPSLGVGEAQPFVANLFTKYAVFLFDIVKCILLSTVDPTRPQQQKLQRQVHDDYRIPFAQVGLTKWSSETRGTGFEDHEIPVGGVLAHYAIASNH
jgi:hypothetical protein